MSDRAERRIKLAAGLFEAWSSNDPDAPEKFFHPDGSLYDVVAGHTFDGWPAIRAFFAQGTGPGGDLALIPDRFWSNGDGVALTWIMSSTVKEGEHRGKKSRVEGVSTLDFDESDLVVREVDYWNGAQMAKSLEEQK